MVVLSKGYPLNYAITIRTEYLITKPSTTNPTTIRPGVYSYVAHTYLYIPYMAIICTHAYMQQSYPWSLDTIHRC